MNAEAFVSRVLDDEGLTEGLEEAQAELLVGWLVKQAEGLAERSGPAPAAWQDLERLCRRARSIGRLVALHSHDKNAAEGARLARAEGLAWPLPDPDDPLRVMQFLLDKEVKG